MQLSESRILIVGLGLIGGSLAQALCGEVKEIRGIDADPVTRQRSVDSGLLTQCVSPGEVGEWIGEMNIVVLATPLHRMVEVARSISPYLRAGQILTDVGSVKHSIMEALEGVIPGEVHWVPGHPMAGTEGVGFSAADGRLFQGAKWMLNHAPPALLDGLIRCVGALPVILEASIHDRVVAHTSHFPLAMAAITASVSTSGSHLPPFRQLQAGGFRDTTRVALGSPELSADLCWHNRSHVLPLIEGAVKELHALHGILGGESRAELQAFFSRIRDDLMDARAGSQCT